MTDRLPGSGNGSALISHSSVDRDTSVASCRVSRWPGLPPSASAIFSSIRCSNGLRRACGTVRPGTCSAKVCFAQRGLSQKNRRTSSRITVSCPPTAGI
ncbi:hypothetical protein [Amycolatopsis sp. lyj-90]|uniref:hypothetical protein n=1 Tax=Amycolatopsis sp. lyj-90 TaxID=2789285 RepID=UPI00397900B2